MFRIIWYDFVVSSMNIFIIFVNGQVEEYSNINNKKFAQKRRKIMFLIDDSKNLIICYYIVTLSIVGSVGII